MQEEHPLLKIKSTFLEINMIGIEKNLTAFVKENPLIAFVFL